MEQTRNKTAADSPFCPRNVAISSFPFQPPTMFSLPTKEGKVHPIPRAPFSNGVWLSLARNWARPEIEPHPKKPEMYNHERPEFKVFCQHDPTRKVVRPTGPISTFFFGLRFHCSPLLYFKRKSTVFWSLVGRWGRREGFSLSRRKF